MLCRAWGSIANIGGGDFSCNGGDDGKKLRLIPGVIGAPSSVTSIQVANLLKLFAIPQVSFFSTSPVLSSMERFPFFLRTIPSDVNQAQAMVELVKMFNWTYVSVVYEESNYGMQGFNEVEKLLTESGICIGTTAKLIKDSGVAGSDAYDKIVEKLKQKSKARGVIIFASDQEVGELMDAVKRRGATGMFVWIGSDGWGGRDLAYLGKEEQVEGAITVQPLAFDVKGFKEYFLSLNPMNNTRNPWFIEYWEQHFSCKYEGSFWTPYNQDYNDTCTGNESLALDGGFTMEAQLQFVSDAVLAFSYALKNMHTDLCMRRPGVCDEMNPIDGGLLKQYLLAVNFTGLSGEEFRFLPNGDGPSRYRILNFRQTSDSEYEWATVGYFRNGKLLNMTGSRFNLHNPEYPESVCSQPCSPLQAQMFLEGETCCWTCQTCSEYQIINKILDRDQACVDCPWGALPDIRKDTCVPIPVTYLRYTDGIAIAAIVLASSGIIFTIWVIIVFLRYRETPIVKASGRELSFVLLLGIFCCYGMTFLLVSKPNFLVCGAQKYGIGLCFTVCYAAILTKTDRIARIFRAGRRTIKRPKFISPTSQLVICGVIVSAQAIIGALWIIIAPPKVVPFYARRDDHQLVCSVAVGSSYMIGFSYPICLVIICTVYAVLTRKIPESFNESQYIGFTMYTTCIIWLAFVPIFFSTEKHIQIRTITMCFAISLSSTVALVCMFVPKLYIIILHPERNIRQSMMATKTKSYATENTSVWKSESQSEDKEIELTQRLRSSPSLCSTTTATQTLSNGNSISTQTLNSIDKEFSDEDVYL